MASIEPPEKESRLLSVSNMGDNVDWISSFPDDILCRIFSHLTTEEVVRTSVLSKRWAHVWKSVPILEFTYRPVFPHQKNYKDRKIKLFENCVENVLSSRRVGNIIEWCQISCFEASDRMPDWVRSTVSYGIQELTHKTSSFSTAVSLPEKLFTCSTLTVLRISGRFLVNVPPDVTLPNLKNLHLSSVVYPDATGVENMFSSCHKLEELHICRENWDRAQTMTISVPSLCKLLMSCALDEEVLGHDSHEWMIVINTLKLGYLKLDDHSSSVNYSACILNSLVEAHFGGNLPPDLCEAISTVKTLGVSAKTMECIEDAHHGKLPVSFRYVSRLELGLDISRSWSMLVSLLESSPNLQVLVFKEASRTVIYDYSYHFDLSWLPLLTELRAKSWTSTILQPVELFLE